MSINEAIAAEVNKALAGYSTFIKEAVTEAIQPLVTAQTDRWYNHEGAAEYLCITPKSLRTFVKNGVVKRHSLNGSNPRYRKSDLDRAMIPVEVNIKRHR